MTLNRLIRRAVASWQAHRAQKAVQRYQKALRRAIPKLDELDRQIAASRKAHRPGTARLQKARRDAIHEAMRGRT